ncbi:MAG TPA: 2-isopropylmalate synthase [Terriglobales bacterium]|nr:2-isopropylmalate synthase [Terriglobales bacterium]
MGDARRKILVFDTTLRDGEQSPGCSMRPAEKLRLACQLEKLGVDVIEAGFPISSEGDFHAVRQIAAEVRGPRIAALARCNSADVMRAHQALEPAARPRIHIFLATSDIHLQFKLKITRQQALEQAARAAELACALSEDVEFSPEDATRSDVDYLCSVLEAVIAAGATTINIPDTVGYTVPHEFGSLIQAIRTRVKGVERATISVHCHNDLGLAVANSLAAIQAGAGQVECTINGIGERAGNAALEELVMAMRVRPDAVPYTTGVNPAEIWPTSRLLSEIISFAPQPNKAIVGGNAFAHEAGIHQHGVLSNPLCYEIMTPHSVGAPGNRIVLGKHSGRHALAKRCSELGWPLSGERLNEVYQCFIELADRKKNLYDQDLLAILGAAKPVATEPTRELAASASGD